MENLTKNINNFIMMISSSEFGNFIIIFLVIAVAYWFVKASTPIYKEFRLKYNSFAAIILAIMTAFIDLVYPNTYRARTAQDTIIQFGMVIVAIIFAFILLSLVITNWDIISKMIQG